MASRRGVPVSARLLVSTAQRGMPSGLALSETEVLFAAPPLAALPPFTKCLTRIRYQAHDRPLVGVTGANDRTRSDGARQPSVGRERSSLRDIARSVSRAPWRVNHRRSRSPATAAQVAVKENSEPRADPADRIAILEGLARDVNVNPRERIQAIRLLEEMRQGEEPRTGSRISTRSPSAVPVRGSPRERPSDAARRRLTASAVQKRPRGER